MLRWVVHGDCKNARSTDLGMKKQINSLLQPLANLGTGNLVCLTQLREKTGDRRALPPPSGGKRASAPSPGAPQASGPWDTGPEPSLGDTERREVRSKCAAPAAARPGSGIIPACPPSPVPAGGPPRTPAVLFPLHSRAVIHFLPGRAPKQTGFGVLGFHLRLLVTGSGWRSWSLQTSILQPQRASLVNFSVQSE